MQASCAGGMWVLKRLVPVGVALLVAAVGVYVGQALGPFFLRSDPDYAYLFNGMGLLQSLAPGHIDHPGTTLQELAAVTILLKHVAGCLAGARGTIAKGVLGDPEAYLRAINYVLLGVNAAVLAVAARIVINRTGSIWLCLLTPTIVFMSPTVLFSLGTVRPEHLLIGFAVTVALLALPTVLPDRRARLLRGVGMGLAVGGGIVTKVTFLPLALFILALPGILSMIAAVLSAAVAIAVLTEPIWDYITDQYHWFQQLATHQGLYGDGDAGLPPLDRLGQNLLSLAIPEPEAVLAAALFVTVALALLVAVRDAQRRLCWRVMAIGFAVIVCQFAIALPRPVSHYLAPSLSILPVLAPMALWAGFRRWGGVVGTAALAGLAAWYGVGLLPDLGYARRASREAQNLVGIAEQQNCRVIPYYLYGSVEYALNFGDGYMRRVYAKDLTELYPDYVEYNLFTDQLLNLAGDDVASAANQSIEAGKALCLIGLIELTAAQEIDVTLIARDTSYFLYRVRRFPEKAVP